MTDSTHKTTREREREREWISFLRKSCSSKTWETKHCNTEKTRVGIACLLANHITSLYFTALHSNSLCKNFNTSSPNLRQHTTRNTTKKEAVDRDARTHARTRASPNPNFWCLPEQKRTRKSEISKLPKKEKSQFPGGPLFLFIIGQWGCEFPQRTNGGGACGDFFNITLSATSELFFPTRCPKSPLLKLPR
jgi:hypothetical protein